MSRRWAWASFVVAAATAIFLALAPLGESTSCNLQQCRTESTSLLEHEGAGVLVIVAMPVVLTGFALVVPSTRLRLAVAVALSLMLLIGILSIGIFLLPTVVLAWIAYNTSARSAAK